MLCGNSQHNTVYTEIKGSAVPGIMTLKMLICDYSSGEYSYIISKIIYNMVAITVMTDVR